jgi:hypothetical protein
MAEPELELKPPSLHVDVQLRSARVKEVRVRVRVRVRGRIAEPELELELKPPSPHVDPQLQLQLPTSVRVGVGVGVRGWIVELELEPELELKPPPHVDPQLQLQLPTSIRIEFEFESDFAEVGVGEGGSSSRSFSARLAPECTCPSGVLRRFALSTPITYTCVHLIGLSSQSHPAWTTYRTNTWAIFLKPVRTQLC